MYDCKSVLFVEAYNEGRLNEVKKGEIEFSNYFNWFKKRVDAPDDFSSEDYIAINHKGYIKNDKAIKLIEGLHSKGIQTALCSNNYKENIDILNRNFNLDKYFDHQIYSYDVGVMKPDPKIFHALVDACGVEAGEIVYAGEIWLEGPCKDIKASVQNRWERDKRIVAVDFPGIPLDEVNIRLFEHP